MEDDKVFHRAATKNGKDIVVVAKGGLFAIQFTSGGELPVDFQGRFTEIPQAVACINKYLERKEAKDNGAIKGKQTL